MMYDNLALNWSMSCHPDSSCLPMVFVFLGGWLSRSSVWKIVWAVGYHFLWYIRKHSLQQQILLLMTVNWPLINVNRLVSSFPDRCPTLLSFWRWTMIVCSWNDHPAIYSHSTWKNVHYSAYHGFLKANTHRTWYPTWLGLIILNFTSHSA